MATSAFKSTSRRITAAADPKAPPQASAGRRRSHSISAISRKSHAQLDSDTLVSTEFSNSRDNPLFWVPSHSASGAEDGKAIEAVSSNCKQSETRTARIANGNSNSDREGRGRSITRSAGNKNGIGRSLSRVRGRPVSRDIDTGVYESKKELDLASTTGTGPNVIKRIGTNGIKRSSSVRDRVDTWSHSKPAAVPVIQNRALEQSEDDSSLMGGKWVQGVPPNQIYETVQSEVRRAITDIQNDIERAFQRNNGSTVSATNVTNILSGLVDSESEAVELVTDIRREYTMKLEESEERARKLRADLAIEEHRGQELGRILKEIVPHPKPSTMQRSRRGRRISNERRRMSKCLKEEAMTFFDECVSLSTFDSSDFSAPEDPMCSSVGGTLPSGASSLVKGSPSTSCSYEQGNGSHPKQGVDSNGNPSGTFNLGSSQVSQLSFAANSRPLEDIRNCIKICYDPEEYKSYSNIENVHIDRVLNSSRIQSGGLLLCSGAQSASSVML